LFAVVLALIFGFVTGWALRGDTFDVVVFEAAGTWAGALALDQVCRRVNRWV